MSRRRRQTKTPSFDFYIGYVEDDETIEAIEKKFEALERIEKETKETKSNEKETAEEGEEEASASVETDGFSADVLQRIFQDTSSFTVASVLDNNEGLFENARRDEGDFFDDDEDEYYYLSEDEFWDDQPRGKRRAGKQQKRGARQQITRGPIHQVVGVNGALGRIVALKKRRKIDPNVPVCTRFPSSPLPLSWALPIQSMGMPVPTVPKNEYKYVTTKDITSFNLQTLGKDFEGVYADPPWHEGFKPSDLAKLKLQNVVQSGLLFIWVEKEYIPEILEVFDKHFVYVENITWVTVTVDNRPAVEENKYLGKAKKIVLVLRKVGQGAYPLQLKHQRNPDVVFDLCRWKDGDKSRGLDKPEALYITIETMLPEAAYKPDKGRGRLLELWGNKNLGRSGWTHVIEE